MALPMYLFHLPLKPQMLHNQYLPSCRAGTVRGNAHTLPAPKLGNYRITQALAGGAALKSSLLLSGNTWSVKAVALSAKSSKCPKTNCMLGLFNIWGLILDTLMRHKE